MDPDHDLITDLTFPRAVLRVLGALAFAVLPVAAGLYAFPLPEVLVGFAAGTVTYLVVRPFAGRRLSVETFGIDAGGRVRQLSGTIRSRAKVAEMDDPSTAKRDIYRQAALLLVIFFLVALPWAIFMEEVSRGIAATWVYALVSLTFLDAARIATRVALWMRAPGSAVLQPHLVGYLYALCCETRGTDACRRGFHISEMLEVARNHPARMANAGEMAAFARRMETLAHLGSGGGILS